MRADIWVFGSDVAYFGFTNRAAFSKDEVLVDNQPS